MRVNLRRHLEEEIEEFSRNVIPPTIRYVFFRLFLWPLLLSGCAHHDEGEPKPVVAVKVARAELETIRVSVSAPATIFPRQQANVASRLTAPIRSLKVRKGDKVSAGQILVVLENRDLLAQREEAVAGVSDAQASLQKVSAGTLPTDVERARGQVATSEAALNQAQGIYERRKELFQQGAIPQRDLLLSQTELAQAKTGYEVALKSLQLLESQSRGKDLQIAESHLAQAKARLELIETQLQFAELRSPFAGFITEQFLYAGDMAKPDAPVFTVMDLSVVVARAQVPEAEAGSVRVGQTGTFAPTDMNGTVYEGHVSVVNEAVDPSRRTLEIWCEIPNRQAQGLRAGAFGTLHVLVAELPRSLTIPLSAVQFREGTQSGSVLVVDERRIATKREVETGQIFNGKIQIKRGLRSGEEVVVEGGYELPDGTQVRLIEDKAK